MFCNFHKNISAVGVCKSCGAAICPTCAENGFPALCPNCGTKAEQKNIIHQKRSNRALLYTGILLSLAIAVISFILYLGESSSLWFLLNILTLILVFVFILLAKRNNRKKKASLQKIENFRQKAALVIESEPPLTRADIKKLIDEAVKGIIAATPKPKAEQKIKPEPETDTATDTPTVNNSAKDAIIDVKPKSAIKEKNNPFTTASKSRQSATKEQSTKAKAVKKVWVCECGMENLTQKLFCMDCGMKRTKEMLANAKEI